MKCGHVERRNERRVREMESKRYTEEVEKEEKEKEEENKLI